MEKHAYLCTTCSGGCRIARCRTRQSVEWTVCKRTDGYAHEKAISDKNVCMREPIVWASAVPMKKLCCGYYPQKSQYFTNNSETPCATEEMQKLWMWCMGPNNPREPHRSEMITAHSETPTKTCHEFSLWMESAYSVWCARVGAYWRQREQ